MFCTSMGSSRVGSAGTSCTACMGKQAHAETDSTLELMHHLKNIT
jgi:hypothetical protein